MVDPVFGDPRLAAVYDALDGERDDLDAYLAIARSADAHRVLDIGCGTGTLALRLADAGMAVVGLDPAAASLNVARAKPGADRVRWIDGDARAASAMTADLVLMTANVAQAIVDPADWTATLTAARRALRPGGLLAFETRDPAVRDWERWTARPPVVAEVPGIGRVESRVVEVQAALPLVHFRAEIRFAADDAVVVSDSTLRFRDRTQVERDLVTAGFAVQEVRDAPDRPGRELVFLARSGE